MDMKKNKNTSLFSVIYFIRSLDNKLLPLLTGNSLIQIISDYLLTMSPAIIAWISSAIQTHSSFIYYWIIAYFAVYFILRVLWVILQSEKEYHLSHITNLYRGSFIQKYLSLDYEKLITSLSQTLAANAKSNDQTYSLLSGIGTNLSELITSLFSIILSLIILIYAVISGQGQKDMLPCLFIMGVSAFFAWISIVLRIKKERTIKEAISRMETSERKNIYIINQLLNHYESGKHIRLFQAENYFLKEISHKQRETLSLIKTIHTAEFPELLVLNIGQLLETILLYSVIIIFISPDEVTNTLFLIGTIQTLTGGIHKSIQAYTKLKTNINRFTDTISWFSLDNDQTNEQVQPSRIKETKILCAADHISFCFPGNNKNTINNVSFSIYQGEHIAIVGPNGSGKSTLIKLLSELYSPSKGMLHFYEVEHKICPVFQDFFLFAYSLKENITFSSNQMQGVKETLSSCDFKPHDAGFSLETPLYKDIYNTGVQLSGGESQKVAIARSIYNAGQLFVFDEPTSALDPISEKEIFELMETLTKDKTVVFVSHRLASCQHCDRILVVDHGRIVQEGTHAELVNQEGLYRDMWNAQADFYMKK